MRILIVNLMVFLSIAPAFAQGTAGGPQSSSGSSFPDWPVSGAQLGAQPALPESPPTAPPPSMYGTRYAASAAEQTSDRVPQSLAETSVPPAREFPLEHASYTTTAPGAAEANAKRNGHRLPPRRENVVETASGSDRTSAAKLVNRFGVGLDSTYSTISALALVLGLFFMGAWVLRKSAKKKTPALPTSVVNVLGRVALAPKQFAELLRVGNKLVLVAITPEGPKPITEVTEPAEVDRLMGLCQQHDPRSPSRAFEHVFRELAEDRAPEGFLGHEAPVIQVPLDTAAYLARGGSRRG